LKGLTNTTFNEGMFLKMGSEAVWQNGEMLKLKGKEKAKILQLK
jgi:hypothetical protein